MSKIMKYAFLLLAAAGLSLAACSSESVSGDMNDMPQAVQTAVKDNFKSEVVKAKVEKNAVGADEYEVTLADGTKVKYENDQWEEVKVPMGQSVPNAFVPEAIRNYVAEKHAGMSIYKIDRDNKGYDVDLSNGTVKGPELKFDTAGNFVKYDD